MTRVDFYVLRPGSRTARERVVCTLVAKAVRAGHRVFVRANSTEQVRALDEQLWTFSDVSFVPHEVQGGPFEQVAPALIGMDEPNAEHNDILMNLSHPVPGCFSRFERVIETVGLEEGLKAEARERYRFYQTRGYVLATHEISDRDD